MNGWEKRFEDIMTADESDIIKTIRLNDLMEHMERISGLPRVWDPEYERKNPYLMRIYRKIAAAMCAMCFEEG